MGTRTSNRIQFAMLWLYFVSTYISDILPGGQLLTVFPIGILLLFAFLKHNGRIRLYAKSYFAYIIIFIVYCALSRFWAVNPRLAVTKINSLLFILLASVVIVLCIYEHRDVDMLLRVIMYGGYFVCIYIMVRYGPKGILRLLSDSTRLSNSMLNANTLGMCAAYSIVINLHFILYGKLRLRDVLMIPALIMLVVSGSRKAIVIVVAGAFGIFVLRNTYNRDSFKKMCKVISISVVAVLLIVILSRLPFFATITRRMMNLISLLQGNETRGTSSAWIRLAYNRLGMQLFKAHPVLGIGIANANIYTELYYGHNHYLHNNFIEILACGGSVGFLIYYSVWMYLLVVFWRNRKHRDRKFDICLILLLINLVMDYGAVSYYDKTTYFFLLLYWMEKDNLIHRKKEPEYAVLNGVFSI